MPGGAISEMGYQRDHSIIVSSHDFPEAKEQIERSRWVAIDTFGAWRVSAMFGPKGITNGRMSFFIAPDGSKEDFPESVANDLMRDKFCDWLQQNALYVNFVEVAFADEARLAPEIGRNSEENVPEDQRGFGKV